LKLAVVIINYNSSADLDRCLESLAAYPPAAIHEVVIVDNASRDEGLAEVHTRYPDHTWLFNSENYGYAKACNQGMALAEADYYLILNPDIVVQPGAMDRLLQFADDTPRAGMVGPQLLNEDGSVQASCRRFYTFRTLLLRRTILGRIFPNSETVRLHLMEDFDHHHARPVDWVLGGCLLVRRSAMERTGPMDERFFLYFEDVDWCYRMWQAGFEVVYAPEARFMHRHRRESAQGKFSKSFWLHLGSLISFYEKWGMLVWLLKKWRDPLLLLLLWLGDMLGLAAAFGLAYGLRGVFGGLFSEPLFPFAEYRPLLLFTGLLATVVFLMTGRYQPGRRRRIRPWTEHAQQVGVVSVLLLASSYLGHQEAISRAVLLLFLPLLYIFTSVADGAFNRLLARLEKGRLSLERTLLVGPPARIQAWLNGARGTSLADVDVAGYAADPSAGGGLAPLDDGNIPWLGTRAEILEVVHRYRISQVVFWDPPAGEAAAWQLLGNLRRLRVRLRWQVSDVWLLAARARVEFFGSEPGAVQQSGAAESLFAFGARLASLAAGVVLGLLAFLPWVWLRLVRSRQDGAAVRMVPTTDIWGHDPRLPVAASGDGRVLPLLWQWRLAGCLLQGRVSLNGPQAVPAGTGLPAAADPFEFWKRSPRAPGLTGPWAAEGGLRRQLGRLWQSPGGLTRLDQEPPRQGPLDITYAGEGDS